MYVTYVYSYLQEKYITFVRPYPLLIQGAPSVNDSCWMVPGTVEE